MLGTSVLERTPAPTLSAQIRTRIRCASFHLDARSIPSTALSSVDATRTAVACNFSAPRGYLLRGANDCQRVRVLGLQAVLFGVSHGYQGLGPCLGITAYGLLFGLLAEGRKSPLFG